MRRILILILLLLPALAFNQTKIDSIDQATLSGTSKFPTIDGPQGAKRWKYFDGDQVREFSAADIVDRAYVPDTTGSHSIEADYGNFVRSTVDGNVYYCDYGGECSLLNISSTSLLNSTTTATDGTTTINFASTSGGVAKYDLTGVDFDTLTLTGGTAGANYTLYIYADVDTATLTFSSNIKSPNGNNAGTRDLVDTTLVNVVYDGTNYTLFNEIGSQYVAYSWTSAGKYINSWIVNSDTSSVEIKWTHNLTEQDSFLVERTTNFSSWTTVANTTDTVITDSALSPENTYYYRVQPYGNGTTQSVQSYDRPSLIAWKQLNVDEPDSTTIRFSVTDTALTMGSDSTWSVELWVEIDSFINTYRHIWGKYSAPSFIQLGTDVEGILLIIRATSTSDEIRIKFPIQSGVVRMGDHGRKLHIVSTYDGLSDAAGINLYLNGKVLSGVNRAVTENTLTGEIGSGSGFIDIIGRGADKTFDGGFVGSRIWNSELSAAQVTNLYNNGTPVANSGINGLIFETWANNAYWDGSQWVFADEAGNATFTETKDFEVTDMNYINNFRNSSGDEWEEIVNGYNSFPCTGCTTKQAGTANPFTLMPFPLWQQAMQATMLDGKVYIAGRLGATPALNNNIAVWEIDTTSSRIRGYFTTDNPDRLVTYNDYHLSPSIHRTPNDSIIIIQERTHSNESDFWRYHTDNRIEKFEKLDFLDENSSYPKMQNIDSIMFMLIREKYTPELGDYNYQKIYQSTDDGRSWTGQRILQVEDDRAYGALIPDRENKRIRLLINQRDDDEGGEILLEDIFYLESVDGINFFNYDSSYTHDISSSIIDSVTLRQNYRLVDVYAGNSAIIASATYVGDTTYVVYGHEEGSDTTFTVLKLSKGGIDTLDLIIPNHDIQYNNRGFVYWQIVPHSTDGKFTLFISNTNLGSIITKRYETTNYFRTITEVENVGPVLGEKRVTGKPSNLQLGQTAYMVGNSTDVSNPSFMSMLIYKFSTQ
jgi:hypothetical protein